MSQFTAPRTLLTITAALALAAGTAACGGDDAQTGAAQPTPTSGPAPAPTAPADQVDAAFVRQMIPHHEMAVDMARDAQRAAGRQEIKDLADEVISAQQREITELRRIARELKVDVSSPEAVMAADAATLGLAMDEMGMSMNHDDLKGASDFDATFITMMIPHHEGAIAMARAALAGGENDRVARLSRQIIAAQEMEIAAMRTWQTQWYGTTPKGDGAADHSDHGGGHDDHSGH